MVTLITILIILATTVTAYYDRQEVGPSEVWGDPQRVHIVGYTYENAQAMEPFISRDGKWFFFNSRNVGTNTSLHYGLIVNSTTVRYLGEIGGEANGPIPHLDAVPAMDDKYNFFWVSTRNYPQNYENLQRGVFDPVTGTIPKATPVHGDIYIRQPLWIVMDQEINRDGSILFYVNAQFSDPPGPLPIFSNISLALRNADGSYSQHPKAAEIMFNVNNYVNPKFLRYGPSSLGTDALELYFTLRNGTTSSLNVATRLTPDEPYGIPQNIYLPPGSYIEPEAPTLSADGRMMMFSRLDCVEKVGCVYINIYVMNRISKPHPRVLE